MLFVAIGFIVLAALDDKTNLQPYFIMFGVAISLFFFEMIIKDYIKSAKNEILKRIKELEERSNS